MYLSNLIHLMGLSMKSTAACTQVRRIRYGTFTLEHALVRDTWDCENIIDNIRTCRTMLRALNLKHRASIDQTVQQKLLGDSEERKRLSDGREVRKLPSGEENSNVS